MTSATPKPRAGEHTPTPWRAELSRTSGYVMSGNFCVASLGDCASPRDINARRIVACVNACEGFSTEGLEKLTVPLLIEMNKNHETERDSLRERERELVAEVESLRAFKRGVDQALNSGDGTYRP